MHEIIILSVVQGITEFLPISSSAHLILISKYFNFNSSSLTLDISLHLGSLLAIVVYFRKDIFDFIKNKNIFLKVLISSIPTMIVGYFLIYYSLIDYLRDPILIGWTTIIFGILLYFSDKKQIKNSIKNDYSFKAAIDDYYMFLKTKNSGIYYLITRSTEVSYSVTPHCICTIQCRTDCFFDICRVCCILYLGCSRMLKVPCRL